jgi:hypothetical protein
MTLIGDLEESETDEDEDMDNDEDRALWDKVEEEEIQDEDMRWWFETMEYNINH